MSSSDLDEDGLDQDTGLGVSYAGAVTGNKAKSSVAPYLPSVHDTCIGTTSHVVSAVTSSSPRSVLIADSGATDHMWPDYEAFTSYTPLHSKYVTLADDTHTPVAGIGSIKILLDGHTIGVRNVLHVPSLRLPLYSLRAHRRMPGCGFVADNERFHVYFPGFVTTVADEVDSYIPYTPLGRSSTSPFEYRQPSAKIGRAHV